MNKNDLLNLLLVELKFNRSKTARFRESLFYGLAVLLILFPFRPFGLSDEKMLQLFFVCLGMSISTFIPIFISQLFVKEKLFVFFNKKWFVQHEILLFLIILPQVCILNFLYSGLIKLMDFSFLGFFRITLYSVVLLTTIFFIKNAIVINNRYHEEIVRLNTKLEYFKDLGKLKYLNQNIENSVKLNFENEEVHIQLNKIILITAWGNYIKILIETDKNSIELVKRGRIKDIECQLENYPEFYRCHRSFIVNLTFVKNIVGNAKKTHIVMNMIENKIPISRENISRVTKIFYDFKNKVRLPS